ncbi:MAG TPA: hypothetical protein GXX17_08255 [Clostridiales bacterium]|nr:hypothetical protein [Clostridiales bacterium]
MFTTQESHTYNWDVFKEKVLNEKLKCLKDFFDTQNSGKGKAALYKILSLLRKSNEKINIARYAYLLARLKPETNNENVLKRYREFSDKMYNWSFNKPDTQQLITAIYIYLYQKRKRSE